ncbi:hypothetical protein [Prosthecobacter sp.]|uniref:hypothetical protein n=1 Tax=Prosthecobacter sp. TaxID=1965333 RepID=UPI003783F0F5
MAKKTAAPKAPAKSKSKTKAPAKSSAAPQTKVTRPPAEDTYRVRIRMYQHGLGDCFLLSFPRGGGQFSHVMIDCGVILGTVEPGAVMTRVAQDIKDTTGGKVDVLVITHEHWDHLSGFDSSQARAIFKDIDFGALWLAWTEDDKNPLAARLRIEREKKKKAAQAAKKLATSRGLHKQAARMAGLLGFFGARAADDGLSGEDEDSGGGTGGALNFLKKKTFPTILETGGAPLSIPGAKGVRVYVLGPPVDESALKKTKPAPGEGYAFDANAIGLTDAFLAAVDPASKAAAESAQPFPAAVRRSLSHLPSWLLHRSPHLPPLRHGLGSYLKPHNQWRSIDDAWLGMGERLALQLDNATNNTSLVLAFELEDTHEVLLFVGDAQAGNWRSWESLKWRVKDPAGDRRTVTSADLLKRTVFYKVGHHGSDNATMREKGLELMTSTRLMAVIPVDTRVAHDVKRWTHMPLPAIRTRLEHKCATVFQSDKAPFRGANAPKMRWRQSPEKFDVRMKIGKTRKTVQTVRQQSLYTDCYL